MLGCTSTQRDRAMFLLYLLSSLFSTSIAYTTEALNDKIDNLPGVDLSEVNFHQFSGYIQCLYTSPPFLFHLHLLLLFTHLFASFIFLFS